jgi:RNA polymerase sigma-70 factor (ECF subfamily)
MCESARGTRASSTRPLSGTTPETESTTHLLGRVREGDRAALEMLFARYLPRLQRWASGRLPRFARDTTDTHDLVQETLLRTLKHVHRFEPRGELAFQAYLRQAVRNRICEELRRFGRRPGREPLDEDRAGTAPSPLDSAIGTQAAERYERALERLRPDDRDLIVARVEMSCGYEEIAAATGRPSTEAARKACERALVRLAKEMSG